MSCFLITFHVAQTLRTHSETTLFHFFEQSGIDPIYAADTKPMGNKNSFERVCIWKMWTWCSQFYFNDNSIPIPVIIFWPY